MNKITNLAFFAALSLFWACDADKEFGGVPAEQGDEVEFIVGAPSRTMYANDQWDATSNQELYWGNYVTSEKDRIRVFCGQAARKVGTYTIETLANVTGQGSNIAGGVTREGDAGVQWGQEGAHTFYAFYPAENAGQTLGADGKTIQATVLPGQSPKTFRAVINGTTYEDANTLSTVAANKTAAVDNQTNIFCQPDMENAVMVAKTEMSAEQFGQKVPLHFNVIADVLDITVNGPIVPNQLAGNAAGQSRDFISIYDVSVVHKDGKPIVGTFNLDMSTSTATNITNGSSRILLQLAQTGSDGKRQVPVLFARVTKSKDENGKPIGLDPATEVDHLRVRAFLAPGVVKNLNELQIVVSTDCGDYTQDLGDYTVEQDANAGNADGTQMVAGKIHRIKLGYFMERGKQFQYDRWMEQLDPTIFINELSIPGTWHSTDADYQGEGNITIVDQYNKGLRAFETHATCVLGVPTLSNQTTGNPSSSVSPSYGTVEPATEADDRNPTSSNDTRTIKRTVTYTQTTTTTTSGTVTKVNYTVTNSAGADLFYGLRALGQALRSTEFAFVEIGSPGSTDIYEPVIGTTASGTTIVTKTIEKEQTGTQRATGLWNYSWSSRNITWNSQEPTDAEWATAPVTGTSVSDMKYAETQSTPVNSFVAGISWLLNELKTASGSKLYVNGITPNTTIADVAGHYIIKINTNNPSDQATESGWNANKPALFSRWIKGKDDSYADVALQWGAPIAPEASNPPLHWVFSELDNIGNSVTVRQTAWNAYVNATLEAYKLDSHNAWFEFSAGGYLYGSKNATNCQAVATNMNPWLLNKITDPTRQACPLGLVFFNCALMNNATYYGESLIRTIINNNAAFPLRRLEPKNVDDNTNSHFNANPNSPFKP
jgi:lipoprotein